MSSDRSLLRGIIQALEAVSEWTGRAVTWLVLVMTLLVGYDVVMRYLFRAGSVGLQELEWHLFALIFLLGAAYTLKHDAHVRLDVLYQMFNERKRAWVNLLGTLFLLLPFCLLIINGAWPFVMNAYAFGEGSPDPGGLPYRFLIKAAIPLGFLLLLLQGLADVLKNLLFLSGKEGPR
jgi:TRAP-type mannitol/chloroaromatic compound transport system permease small subunit